MVDPRKGANWEATSCWLYRWVPIGDSWKQTAWPTCLNWTDTRNKEVCPFLEVVLMRLQSIKSHLNLFLAPYLKMSQGLWCLCFEIIAFEQNNLRSCWHVGKKSSLPTFLASIQTSITVFQGKISKLILDKWQASLGQEESPAGSHVRCLLQRIGYATVGLWQAKLNLKCQAVIGHESFCYWAS